MFRSRKKLGNQGQAVVEFALIIIVLLLIIFFIVEASRILWAWVTVQNAARAGARYGLTGEADLSCLNDVPPCDDPRLTSIKNLVTENLTGLRLDPDADFEDGYFHVVQVYGVNALGVFQEDYAGLPGLPLAVRVVYNVPIITPILSGIVENIPVMGQVVVNNEQFGQQGGSSQGQGLPPPIPVLPTPGPTPSYTPTPSPTPSFTPGPPPTATTEPTAEATPTCQTQFTGPVIEGDRFIGVTGGLGADPPIIVQLEWIGTVTQILDTAVLEQASGWVCPGHGEFALDINFNLTQGMILIARNLVDGTFKHTIVLAGTPTPTPLPTNTPLPTTTPTPSLTPTPSATPIGPYINSIPNCWNPGNPFTSVELIGGNWPLTPPTQSAITITLLDRFGNSTFIRTLPQGHGGYFEDIIVNVGGLTAANSPYTFMAQAVNGASATSPFFVPCVATPTVPPLTPTPSPAPADLIIVSYPTLVSTPPIRAYEPVTFSYVITNTGNVNISSQFFVDTYFDPMNVTSTTVPITYSKGYDAIGDGLAGGISRTVVITIHGGFTGMETSHTVVGMVDSIEQIIEDREDNNITGVLVVPVTPPAETPTPTPTPSGDSTIAGIVRIFTGSDWVPQFRAHLYLVQTSGIPTPTIVAQTDSSVTGSYFFNYAVPGVTYTVYACFTLNTSSGIVHYTATRPGITSPNFFVDMFMLASPGGCPAPTPFTE